MLWIGRYPLIIPGIKAKIKLREDDHVTPHVAGKTWIFLMKSIRGAKLHGWIAARNERVAKLHRQTKVPEIEIICA
jgi:hypothetical protein